MLFDLEKSLEILRRTPKILKALLSDLSEEWVLGGGQENWSPYYVIGHFIHGEKTDWMPRVRLILSDKKDKTFEPFDRFAQFTESRGRPLQELLVEFERLRESNLNELQTLPITENLEREGIHPALGVVTLRQLISTWVVHDLNHLTQVLRFMARQYSEEVGPWKEYLSILS